MPDERKPGVWFDDKQGPYFYMSQVGFAVHALRNDPSVNREEMVNAIEACNSNLWRIIETLRGDR